MRSAIGHLARWIAFHARGTAGDEPAARPAACITLFSTDAGDEA